MGTSAQDQAVAIAKEKLRGKKVAMCAEYFHREGVSLGLPGTAAGAPKAENHRPEGHRVLGRFVL